MMPSLMIDHLSINLRSGTDNLVSEISFAIKEGESLILLGQSGSGKTMTCSAVLNLLDPKKFKVSGSVFFGETDLLNSSEKQRRGIYGNQIVYIPQNPMTALDPSMRIGRQMDETLRLHSDKSRQQRYNYILRLLHDVGLDDPDRVYRAYPHMLSGGMLQRVIIAMAMMLDAKFVLADEPTTALDVIHRNGIIDLFSQMKANGVGILMVTHDFATALQLGGNVLVMKEGKIIESGEVQSVFDHTTEPYTRSLIEAYLLMMAKVQKRWAATILGAIMCIIWFVTGMHWAMALGYLIMGIAADLVAGAGRYQSKKINSLSYILLSLGGTGSYLVFFADPDGWAKTMLGNGTEQSYIDTMRSTGTVWIMVVMLAGTILAAAVSAFIGCKMLKKQFEKAGITK